MIPEIRLLRGTPEGLAAREAISRSSFNALCECIKTGPGFLDNNILRARRELRVALRLWAMTWIKQRDAALPRDKRRRVHEARRELTEQEKRGTDPNAVGVPRRLAAAAERLEKAARLLREAEAALQSARVADALRPYLRWPAGRDNTKRRERVRWVWWAWGPDAHQAALAKEVQDAWREELSHLRPNLLRLARSAREAAAETGKGGGAHERVLHEAAIGGLWHIWREARGELAAAQGTTERRVANPLYKFVGLALASVWPGAGSVTGKIGDVCTRFRQEHPI